MDFGNIVDKAKDWAGKNPEKADGYVDKGTDALKGQVGHEEQVDSFAQKGKDYLHGPQGEAPPPPPPGEQPPPPPPQ